MSVVVALRKKDGSSEFDCTGCGQRIVRVVETGQPPVCAICEALPAWHEDAELRRIFHHDGGATPEAAE
jgi:hypothetical protein